MTKQNLRYYYFEPESKTFYHSMKEQAFKPEWMFMGTSENPNTKMVVTSMVRQLPDVPTGYTIKAV